MIKNTTSLRYVSLAIVFLIISVGLSPQIEAELHQEESDSLTMHPCLRLQTDSALWAVIITVGDQRRDSHGAMCITNLVLSQGYPQDHLFYLFEEAATKTNILKQPFEWLKNQSVQPEDRIIFFFSMHGTRITDQQPFDEPDGFDECLVPFDDDGDKKSYLLDDELAACFNQFSYSNLLCIFETCYSGGMIDGEADLKADGRVIITSSAADESSWPLYLPYRWLFPHYLCRAFTGMADHNDDCWVSAEEAYTFAAPRAVWRSSLLARLYGLIPFIPHDFYPQHPQFFDGWPSKNNNTADLLINNKTFANPLTIPFCLAA